MPALSLRTRRTPIIRISRRRNNRNRRFFGNRHPRNRLDLDLGLDRRLVRNRYRAVRPPMRLTQRMARMTKAAELLFHVTYTARSCDIHKGNVAYTTAQGDSYAYTFLSRMGPFETAGVRGGRGRTGGHNGRDPYGGGGGGAVGTGVDSVSRKAGCTDYPCVSETCACVSGAASGVGSGSSSPPSTICCSLIATSDRASSNVP